MHRKFFIFVIAALLNTAVFAAARPFTGFYVGGNMGWTNLDVTDKQNLPITSLETSSGIISEDRRIYSASSSENQNGVTGGVSMGYAHFINENYILGLEGRANLESLNIPFNYQRNTITQSSSITGAVTFNNQVKLDNDFAFVVKLGINPVTSPILFYALVGPAWGNFEVSESFSFDSAQQSLGQNAKHSSYETGILAGVGMEYHTNQHINLAFEFTHTDYGSIDIKNINQTLNTQILSDTVLTTINLNSSINAKTNNFTLRLNYYF